MKWFEFIRLCTTAERAQELAQALSATVHELRQKPGVIDVIVARHALYDGQLGVAVVHDDAAGARQTKEALAVADHLRHYGLVDHQAWAVIVPDAPSVPASAAVPSHGEKAVGTQTPPARR